jgi:ribulose 1,5-bisphosphate synthetase/thiazole synthase
VSRRGFLAGAGAAAATLMLPRASKAAPQPTIAIVGGGIAELSCAVQLADAGLSSTVYRQTRASAGGCTRTPATSMKGRSASGAAS